MDDPVRLTASVQFVGVPGPDSMRLKRPIFFGPIHINVNTTQYDTSFTGIDFNPSSLTSYSNSSTTMVCAHILSMSLDPSIPKNMTDLYDASIMMSNVRFGSYAGFSPCIVPNVPLTSFTIKCALVIEQNLWCFSALILSGGSVLL